MNEDYEALWEFAKFLSLEAFLLRSLLENLNIVPQSDASKLRKISEWRNLVGTQMGNPEIVQLHSDTFRKSEEDSPQQRRQDLRNAMAAAQARYLGISE